MFVIGWRKTLKQEVMALNLYLIVANKKKAKEKDYAESIPSFISLNPSGHPSLQQMYKYKVKLCRTKM
jgi:hypothetical protein